MIYEKNCKHHIEVSRDDLYRPHVTISTAAAAPRNSAIHEDVGSTEARQKSKKHLRVLSRKIRRKKRMSAFFAAFMCLIICFFGADQKIYGGVARTRLMDGAKNIIMSALQDDNTMSQYKASPERTIYSLSFSESVRENDIFSELEGTKDTDLINTDSKVQNDTATVSSSVSESYIDGTKYYPITSLDLSSDNIYALSNATSFDIDASSLSGTTPESLKDLSITRQPLVLILHTHGCEAYSDYSDLYPETAETRSGDKNKNVVRIGAEIASVLSDFGISSVHCDTLHDEDSFINAYSESAKSVKKYLEEYPSIRFVIDVHRDAIIRDSGESISAQTDIAGQDFAQIMFVVGTNEQGHNHPEWQENLALAVKLQESISNTYPSLCRNINLRNVPFNQQLSSGYLLLEVGTSANTLDQALRSARAFGQEFARVIISNSQSI